GTRSGDTMGVESDAPRVVFCWRAGSPTATYTVSLHDGLQLSEPSVECYQTAVWNPATCAWDVTGNQPEAPVAECWQTVAWNDATSEWHTTETQPPMKIPCNFLVERELNSTTRQSATTTAEAQE